MSTIWELPIRELDQRHSDGMRVTLYWNSQTNDVFLTIEDDRLGTWAKLEVPAQDALEAFRHPHAYAGRARPPRALAA